MTRLTIGLILGIAVVQAGRGQQAPPGGEQKQPGAPEARRRFAVGSVKLGKLIVAPKAEIPRLAVLARIRGWVRMEAEIVRSRCQPACLIRPSISNPCRHGGG